MVVTRLYVGYLARGQTDDDLQKMAYELHTKAVGTADELERAIKAAGT